jgi:hypothetical protein
MCSDLDSTGAAQVDESGPWRIAPWPMFDSTDSENSLAILWHDVASRLVRLYEMLHNAIIGNRNDAVSGIAATRRDAAVL